MSPWTVSYTHTPPNAFHDGRWHAELSIGVGSNTSRVMSAATREDLDRQVREFLESEEAKRLESVYARSC